MKLSRSQIILIAILISIIVLAGIAVPLGIYLMNRKDSDAGNSTTVTTPEVTTTPGPIKTKIIKDLNNLEDTLKKFSDDVATLLTKPKLFREEVEHFKTSTKKIMFEEWFS